jgi:DNA segregation ATPase FtsK/SpoIIIE-like protein
VDHVLVVDGWSELPQELANKVVRLANLGLAYGIHVVVTANRWPDLPAELRDVLDGRIELRLGDRAAEATARARLLPVMADMRFTGDMRSGKSPALRNSPELRRRTGFPSTAWTALPEVAALQGQPASPLRTPRGPRGSRPRRWDRR